LYVLKSVLAPAILIELGFITNPQEEAKLHNPKYQEQIIKAIEEGVDEYEKSR
jgi:N-acetylmuramoyl-L-alanine amidase